MDTDENVVIDPAEVLKEKEEKEEKDGEPLQEAEKIKKKVEKEKIGYDMENMSRVLPAQIKHITFSPDGRYQPVKKVSFPDHYSDTNKANAL